MLALSIIKSQRLHFNALKIEKMELINQINVVASIMKDESSNVTAEV